MLLASSKMRARVGTRWPKHHTPEGTKDSVKFHLEKPQDFKAAIALEI